MITKETYLEMKELIAKYEAEQLNSNGDVDCKNLPYLEEVSVHTDKKYNPNFGDDKICKCGHPYYRHFDSYEMMETVGCKYCGCYLFEEALGSEKEITIQQYINMGIDSDKIHFSEFPTCRWSITRKCLVGNTLDGPPPEELVKGEDGNHRMTYENNRIVNLQLTTWVDWVDVAKINESEGIIITNNIDGCFRFTHIPTK
jgi:hypothetical protein